MASNFLFVNDNISIPMDEIDFTFVKSSGPGGQKVNKTSSQAVLKWSIEETNYIPDNIKEQIKIKLKNRINKLGEVVIQCDVHRDRTKNISECLERLATMLAEAAFKQKKRRPTKPSWSSQQKRMDDKKRQSDKKKNRKIDY